MYYRWIIGCVLMFVAGSICNGLPLVGVLVAYCAGMLVQSSFKRK